MSGVLETPSPQGLQPFSCSMDLQGLRYFTQPLSDVDQYIDCDSVIRVLFDCLHQIFISMLGKYLISVKYSYRGKKCSDAYGANRKRLGCRDRSAFWLPLPRYVVRLG